ncbi:MAG: hypothetical protein LBD77_09995, partial [Bifidobacteriaceae bacterium]|nr:hypothetical protein [Bifidobacteriaceae bacterium]
ADTSELFRRLDALGSGEQEAVARAEYGDQLAKVAKVLGEDYYLNILAYPELWEDPDGRAKAVKDAVAAFAKQIVQNIRQVNDAHDLRFQVPLEALDRIQRRPSAGLDPASPPAGRSTRAQRRRAREQDQGGRAR